VFAPKHILRFSIIVSGCIFALSLHADPPGIHRFALPDHGAILLQVPNSWSGQIQHTPNRVKPNIVLSPVAGPRFEVRLTTWWTVRGSMPPSIDVLERGTQNLAKSVKSQPANEAIEVKPLGQPAARGYYFSATDAQAGPEGFKFYTRGMARVGQLTVAFTILTDDPDSSIVMDALNMVNTAISLQ
jgi:hypothetical protein